MTYLSEPVKPKRRTLWNVLRKNTNWKCLILTVLILSCLGAIVWCRNTKVTKILVDFNAFPITRRQVSPCEDGYVYIPIAFVIMLYLLYLVECWHSNARILLSLEKIDVNSVYRKIHDMKESQPVIWWKAICYHYVRRVRQTTRYRNGETLTSTQPYYERVNSNAVASSFFYNICGMKDFSKEVAELEKHPATKIKFSKGFVFANLTTASEFEEQRTTFFREQERLDDFMEMREGFEFSNVHFNETLVAWVQPERPPWFGRINVFWFFSLLLLSWPIRISLELNTAHLHYKVTKLFGINYPSDPTLVALQRPLLTSNYLRHIQQQQQEEHHARRQTLVRLPQHSHSHYQRMNRNHNPTSYHLRPPPNRCNRLSMPTVLSSNGNFSLENTNSTTTTTNTSSSSSSSSTEHLLPDESMFCSVNSSGKKDDDNDEMEQQDKMIGITTAAATAAGGEQPPPPHYYFQPYTHGSTRNSWAQFASSLFSRRRPLLSSRNNNSGSSGRSNFFFPRSVTLMIEPSGHGYSRAAGAGEAGDDDNDWGKENKRNYYSFYTNPMENNVDDDEILVPSYSEALLLLEPNTSTTTANNNNSAQSDPNASFNQQLQNYDSSTSNLLATNISSSSSNESSESSQNRNIINNNDVLRCVPNLVNNGSPTYHQSATATSSSIYVQNHHHHQEQEQQHRLFNHLNDSTPAAVDERRRRQGTTSAQIARQSSFLPPAAAVEIDMTHSQQSTISQDPRTGVRSSRVVDDDEAQITTPSSSSTSLTTFSPARIPGARTTTTTELIQELPPSYIEALQTSRPVFISTLARLRRCFTERDLTRAGAGGISATSQHQYQYHHHHDYLRDRIQQSWLNYYFTRTNPTFTFNNQRSRLPAPTSTLLSSSPTSSSSSTASTGNHNSQLHNEPRT